MSEANLFFSAFSSYGATSGSYWSTMAKDICDALEHENTPTCIVESNDHRDFIEKIMLFRQKPRDFIATFNMVSPFHKFLAGEKEIFIHEMFSARAATLFLDHPVHLAATIASFEQAARHHDYRPATAPPPVYGVMEEDHALLLQDLGIDSHRIFLFPQAGPAPQAPPPPLAERPFDFVFYGTVADLEDDETFMQRHGFVSPLMRDIVQETLNCALTGQEDVYSVSKRRFAAIGFSGDVLRSAGFAKIIDIRARLLRRWRLLSSLSALRIHFIGNVSEKFMAANENGVYLGPMPFDELTKILEKSKVSINDTINLRQSALMRHHYSMSYGCISATESNSWYRDNFTDNGNVILLDYERHNAERLHDLLSEADKVQAISEAGRKVQAERHQWIHRIEPFKRALSAT